MKQQSIKKTGLKLFLLVLGVFIIHPETHGQCDNRITEEAGNTQHFMCTDVAVSVTGGYLYYTGCNIGPYQITGDGSFTFTFSNPVNQVAISLIALNNHTNPLHSEETTLEINGLPFAFPNNGLPPPSDCGDQHAVVTPWGSLQAPLCQTMWCSAGCEDLIINASISSLTITNTTLVGNPSGITFSISFCSLYAGTIHSDALALCPSELAVVPPATGTYLVPGTLLQYILCSDPNDLAGSIISTSNTPSFAFNPATMQSNTTYYIAAMAGDNLNSNVDMNGACVVFSNAIEVSWWASPTVSLSAENSGICIGNCAIITALFTGDPPFSLTYTSTLTGLVTQVFQESNSTFEICAPPNMPPGNLLIQAIKLTDAHCICD